MITGAETEIGLSFTAPDHIGRSQDCVISYSSKVSPCSEFSEAIRIIQSPETLDIGGQLRFLEWEAPRSIYSQSLSELMEATEFPAGWEINSEHRNGHELRFDQAITLIKEKLPVTALSIEKLIFMYLFALKFGYQGGSVSSRIGMIWLAPTPSWDVTLWAENIVHEFIHNALFLEDMIFGIFPYSAENMAEPEALTLSAIRKVKRGYDKSFHAAFVALGIIRFYQNIGMPQKAAGFVVPLIHSVEDIVKRTDYLSQHGKELLDELVEATVQLPERLLAA